MKSMVITICHDLHTSLSLSCLLTLLYSRYRDRSFLRTQTTGCNTIVNIMFHRRFPRSAKTSPNAIGDR